MAITAEDSEQGKPTSWSGAVDSIAYNNGKQAAYLWFPLEILRI